MTDLRLTFDEDPEVYDRIRPSYPEALFDDLWQLLANPDSPAICEVGAGTGKATASLLAYGSRVTAVEIGPRMAAHLSHKFADADKLQVMEGPFETVPSSGEFDAVFAATSWHWVDPTVRLGRAAALLRPGGWLAVVNTVQVRSPADRGYFAVSQPIYERYGEGDDTPTPLPDEVHPDVLDEIDESPLFATPILRTYRWDQAYSRAEYQDLMRSYSGMRAMGDERRERLIGELGDLIDRDFDGRVTRPLVITLVAARRLSAGS